MFKDGFNTGMVVVAIIMIIFSIVVYVNAKSNCENGTLVTSAEPLHPYACIQDK